MKPDRISLIFTVILNTLALLLLLGPVWEYGFPLLYSDSGTYMAAAYDGSVPIDRPMAYSWFLRLGNALFSMRFAPVAQGILIIYTTYLLIHLWLFPDLKKWVSGLILCLLALITGLPQLVSQLMPDVFTGLLFFAALLWINKSQVPVVHRVFIVLIILFLVSVHTTHLLIFMALYPALLLLYGLFLKKWKLFSGSWILLPCLVILPMVNQWTDGRFYYSDSSRIFFVASLQTAGVLSPWMEEHCGEPEAPLFLCRHKEELKGKEGNYILWTSRVLLDSACEQEAGWGYCWKLRNEELKPFMKVWWKDPQSRQIWLAHALKATRAQVLDFEIGFIKAQQEGSAPYQVLESRYPTMLPRYKASAQYQGDIHFDPETRVQKWSVLTSIALMLLLMLYGWKSKQWKKEWTLLLIGLILFLLINAFVCGVFSNALNRYQARVIWLIPFFTLAFSALFLNPLLKPKG